MRHSVDVTHFASLLRAAARLSPQELLFISDFFERFDADLPGFHRTTSRDELVRRGGRSAPIPRRSPGLPAGRTKVFYTYLTRI